MKHFVVKFKYCVRLFEDALSTAEVIVLNEMKITMNGNLGNDLEGMVIVYLMILPLHSPTETGEYQ